MAVTFRYELPEIMKIALLKTRILLCSQDDVVVEGGQLKLIRKGIRECWARVDERRGSLTGVDGLTIKDLEDQQSHIIMTRYMWDIDMRNTAWIYEARRKSPPRWFKVLGVADSRLAYILSCRQVERSDEAIVPVASTSMFDPRPLPKEAIR